MKKANPCIFSHKKNIIDNKIMLGKFFLLMLIGSLASSALAYPGYMNSVCDLSDPAVVVRNGVSIQRLSTPGTIFYTNMTVMGLDDPYQSTFENHYSYAIGQVNTRVNTPDGCSNMYFQLLPTGPCVRLGQWEGKILRQSVAIPSTGSFNDILSNTRELPVQHRSIPVGYPPAEYLGLMSPAISFINTVDSDISYSSMVTVDYLDGVGIQHRTPILKEYISATADPRAFYYSDDDHSPVYSGQHTVPHWIWGFSKEWTPTDPDAPAYVPLAYAAYAAYVAGQVPLVLDPVGQALGINNMVYMYCPSSKMGTSVRSGPATWVDNQYSRITYNMIREGQVEGIDKINWVPGMHVSEEKHNEIFGL